MKMVTSFCLAFFLLAFSQSFAADKEVSKLTLSSEAVLYKPSDEAYMQIGIVTIGATAEETLSKNSKLMQNMILKMEEAGLAKGEYETGQFSIQPTYVPYPKDPPPDWKPSINGYEVNNAISIHTNKLDLIGKLIDAASRAEANSISGISFGLRNPQKYWEEALNVAMANALNNAKIIASAANAKLLRILSITLDDLSDDSSGNNKAFMYKTMTNITTPIEPGQVTISAKITLVYEIIQ